MGGGRGRGWGEYDGVLTDSRHNERNEGDSVAIKMMGLCISHTSRIVIDVGVIVEEGKGEGRKSRFYYMR